ncbi:MAG: alpha-L-fucosidase [Pirellulales bacterium]
MMLAAVVARAGDHNPDTDWMSKSTVGAFMHFLPDQWKYPRVNDEFDVEAVVKQLVDAKVGWFMFTLGQNSGYFNAPNATYDRITGYAAGERCSKRDIPKELAAALKPHGIRLVLYLPCQTPNRDLQAIRAFGLPEEPANGDRKLDVAFAEKWALVIQEWADRYGDSVSGWWFDGGYAHVAFGDQMAEAYADAVRHGNPRAIVTFNRGITLRRGTTIEDYTAGEFFPLQGKKESVTYTSTCNSRWLDGSQWHILTTLGGNWGQHGEPRFGDDAWTKWIPDVAAHGGAITFDVGPNYDPKHGPVGSLGEAQFRQLRAISEAAAAARAAKPK